MRRPLLPVGLLLALVLAAPAARATPARIGAMGDLGRYVEDDTSVLLFPGAISRHTHFVFVDLAGDAGSPALWSSLGDQQELGALNGGAFLRLAEGLQLGLMTSSYAPGELGNYLDTLIGDPAVPGSSEVNPDNLHAFTGLRALTALRRYDLLLGFSQSEYLGAGLRLSFGSAGRTFVPDQTTLRENSTLARDQDSLGTSQFRAQFGLSGSMGDGYTWDVAAEYTHYGLWFEKNREAGVLFSGNGGGLSARGKIFMSSFWDLVPQISYRLVSLIMREDRLMPAFGEGSNGNITNFPGNTNPPPQRTHDRLMHDLDLGAAGVLKATPTTRFWVATGVAWRGLAHALDNAGDGANVRTDTFTSTLALPYLKFAVEATPLPWLILRAAAEKYAFQQSTTVSRNVRPDGGVTSIGRSGQPSATELPDFNAYVGASFLISGFSLDLLLDNQFFRRGPAFLSGQNGNLAARASVGYKF